MDFYKPYTYGIHNQKQISEEADLPWCMFSIMVGGQEYLQECCLQAKMKKRRNSLKCRIERGWKWGRKTEVQERRIMNEIVPRWNKLSCEVVSFPFIQLCRLEIWECAFTPFWPSFPKIPLIHPLFSHLLPTQLLSREPTSPA